MPLIQLISPRPFCVTRRGAMAALAASGAALVGCTTTNTTTPNTTQAGVASTAAELNAQAQEALQRLYHNVPGSRALVSQAAGVLVFPSILGGGFVVGAEYGRGVLLLGARPVSYYNTIAGSLGFQAGAQSRSLIYVFNSRSALEQFRGSNGWTVGIDATVAFATIGANGQIDSHTAERPVVAFSLTNVGLEAGASIQGSKINRIEMM
ncbi:MAG: twin-arginine translocation pathway signal [Burkholderiaceae bacterium]|jgi:lipid-binding SYLF domain-containing protein|nr:twin-arginine translocation pathway signal [Burkholderiaceae bacterium]